VSRARRALERAQDVLAGRLRVSVTELFDLIHDVNPTGRMEEREARREYEVKSRLQSLLVRSFGDELRVTAEPDGTIAIAHRYSSRDGCHARLDALDDAARSWIRWQLDTAEAPSAPAPVPVPRRGAPGEPLDALERGRRALAEYDFDAAVACFREALADGGVEPARALVEVLVDSLAQDDEAIALEDELDPDARDDEDVRCLLGLAAARTGDVARAQRWLHGVRHARASEAWCALTWKALEQRSPVEAQRAIHEVEAHDANTPALVELRAALTELRAVLRRPDEEALEAIVTAGDDERAEVRAREILERWPDSAIARRALAGVADRRRRRLADAARLDASEALARRDLSRAKELAQRAAELGADVRELVASIDAARSDARAADDSTRVEHVIALLHADESRGLAAYLELEPRLRTRARSGVDIPTLRWLDELAPSERLRRAAVDAVIALRHGRAAADAGEHARALQLLADHTLLDEVRDARAIRARARDALGMQRQQAGVAALEAAAAALDRGDTVAAKLLLDSIDRRALPPEQRSEAERLVATVQRDLELDARARRIDELIAAGDFLGARREIEASPEDSGARLDEVRAALRRTWRVRTATRTSPEPGWLTELLGHVLPVQSPEACVSAAGEVVLAVAHGCHVFVAALAPGARCATVHHVETPSPLGRSVTCSIDGERLWIGGERHVLQLEWRTGDVVRWEPLAAFMAENAVLENVFFLPRSRSMWIESMNRGERGGWEVRVVDLDRWSTLRTMQAGRYLVFIPGDEALIGALDDDTGAALHAGRGGTAGPISELRGMRVSAVARHPGGAGFVALAAPPDDDDIDVSLYEIVPGRPVTSIDIPDIHPEMTLAVVSARECGLVFVYAMDRDGAQLVAFRPGPAGPQALYSVAAPPELFLLVDPPSRRAFAVWQARDDVHVAELSEQPPSFGEILEREPFPPSAPYFICAPAKSGLFKRIDDLLREARWDEVVHELETVEVQGMPPDHREHLQHLLGLAYARMGNAERAHSVWTRGLDYAEPDRILGCHLDACLQVVEELTPSHLPDPLVVALRRAIAAADYRRAHDDLPGALAALRVHGVFRTSERQGLARLADAWLALPDTDALAWFDKAQALAQFLDVEARRERDLPIPGAWGEARIADVAARARAWFAD
jgi:hypothetical protein